MAEGTVEEPPVNRRRIIERPRLTRLLDESPARVKMLVAPAGYGKTTLARQWLATRSAPAIWIQCLPSSADVAVLLESVAAAARDVAKRSTERTIERLRAATAPGRELSQILDLLVADLRSCPDAVLIIFDDYHEVMGSHDAEHAVSDLITRAQRPVLVTSRRRPSWASARALVYGELLELTQAELAMTVEEARDVFANNEIRDDRGVAAAHGWPALIGLAATTPTAALRSDQPHSMLYDYIAGEVFSHASREAQAALREIAVAPRSHSWLLHRLHPPDVARAIETEATRLGMFSSGSDDTLELHPLLREFLHRQCLDHGEDALSAATGRLWGVLAADERWDDLFSLLVGARQPNRISTLLSIAFERLVAGGRAATLRRWVNYARENGVDDQVVRLADAEIALREGQFARAEVLAIEAATVNSDQGNATGRAWCIAGQAAHLSSNDAAAMTYFDRALTQAGSAAVERTARWGSFVVAIDLERADAESILRQIIASTADDISGVVERSHAQLLYELRLGGIKSLHEARRAHDVIDRIADPVRRTAFRSAYASALGLAARYREGLTAADEALADAEDSRVDFAIPYAHTARGLCLLGLRMYDDALTALYTGESAAKRLGDVYGATNARAAISRVMLSQGEHDAALQALEFAASGYSTVGLAGEVLACRAVALACLGDTRSLDAVQRARKMTRSLETRVLTAVADAIVASTTNTDVAAAASAAFNVAQECGAWDLLVCGYRAHPEMLLPLRVDVAAVTQIRQVMNNAQDKELCATLGLHDHPRGSARLSPRESEIHGLVALGLSNREIAARLVISEATVKVHVHHILEKLGVRSRVAAAARYRESRRLADNHDASA